MKKNKAVFLDRDGTIIEDLGYINSPDKIKFYPETFDALKIISEQNFMLFIVTNQQGVARNFISKNELEKVHQKLIQKLNAKSIKIQEIFTCIHDSSDNCECRKPSPLFLKKAAEKYNIDLKNSYVIGDHPSDFLTAKNAGAKGLYLLSGHGLKHRSEAEKINAKILPDILSAAEFIQINENLRKIYTNEQLEEKILEASSIIKNSGVVIMPTETVYGLAANAETPEAVKKIFSIKKRPFYDPLIVHISNFEMLNKIVSEIPEKAKILIENLWPGPLTIVLKKKHIIPDIVTANLNSVAVRMPMHPIALKLIDYSASPIAAPSANLFSQLSPTRFSDISEEIIKNANFAIDGGNCIKGLESTIISFLNEDKPQLLRAGSISLEKIEKLIGKISIRKSTKISSEAPGMQKKHYSPKTPMFIIQSVSDITDTKKINSALLSFKKIPLKQASKFKITKILASDCDFRKAGAQLYSILSDLDKLNLDSIYTILPEKKGLGLAIADRLIRASAKINKR